MWGLSIIQSELRLQHSMETTGPERHEPSGVGGSGALDDIAITHDRHPTTVH